TDPWTQYEQVYAEGSDTTGKVTDINDGGLVVELPLEAEGFVPASHLARQGRPVDAYHVGDEIELTVLRLDRDEREIVLSETAKQQAAERAERHAERAEKTRRRQEERRAIESYQRTSTGPATLGELSGLAALRDQMEAREGAASDEGAAEGAAPAPASAEDTGEAGASEQPPVGEAPSEAQSKAVEAEQPEETAPPVTTGGGSSDLEGAVGTKNRGRAGKRKEGGGDYPPAERRQAAFKGADLHEEGVAGQAEAAVEDETPGTAPSTLEPQYTGPEVETPEDVAVPDELAQPADEAVRDLENEAEGSEEEEK